MAGGGQLALPGDRGGWLIEDLPAAIATLGVVKDLGVRLAVDDFGTGYSSLGYLRRFPVDVLKIDRSFVGGIADHAEDAELVSAIVAMARALDLEVVAEGVETPAQLARLREMGCNLIQGYLFARPSEPGSVERLATEHGMSRAIQGAGVLA